MISYVAKEAALDRNLTPLSLRLLIFLGGENPHIGGFSCHSYKSLAAHFHVSQQAIKGAQHLLFVNGYLVRRVGTITREHARRKTPERHFFYSTNTGEEQKAGKLPVTIA